MGVRQEKKKKNKKNKKKTDGESSTNVGVKLSFCGLAAQSSSVGDPLLKPPLGSDTEALWRPKDKAVTRAHRRACVSVLGHLRLGLLG